MTPTIDHYARNEMMEGTDFHFICINVVLKSN